MAVRLPSAALGRTEFVRRAIVERVTGDPLAHVSPGVRLHVGGLERLNGEVRR